jgi:hypothetical protein
MKCYIFSILSDHALRDSQVHANANNKIALEHAPFSQYAYIHEGGRL